MHSKPRTLKVKHGDDFLPDISISQLSEMQRNEPPGKSRDKLKAAKLRKRGWTLDRIADIVEYAEYRAWLAAADVGGGATSAGTTARVRAGIHASPATRSGS